MNLTTSLKHINRSLMTKQKQLSSPDEYFANLIIEELYRCGIDTFFIAPGSRSTPLVFAIANHKFITSHIHYDERGLGFLALGHAKSTKKPTVIIVTSGSAVANLFPAIIEAYLDHVPLVILSADRPCELRDTGANQTIDQVKIFSSYVRYFKDLPPPNELTSPKLYLTTINQAVYISKSPTPGPVHLNLMFREPFFKPEINHNFQELNDWTESSESYTQKYSSTLQPNIKDIENITTKLSSIKNGIILLGSEVDKEDLPKILALSKKTSFPIFADPLSPLRYFDSDNIIHYFDLILKSTRSVLLEGIIQFGKRIVSKSLLQFLEDKKTSFFLTCHPFENSYDTLRASTHHLSCTPATMIDLLLNKLVRNTNSPLLKKCMLLNKKIDPILTSLLNNHPLSEPSIARILTKHVSANHFLFLGPSMPIRDASFFSSFSNKLIDVYSNRGASGIDGNIATIAGLSSGLKKKGICLVGDQTLLHDLNSLALIAKASETIKIIVINNFGGGVFSFLPISKNEAHFESYFANSHAYSFEAISKMFSIDYQNPKSIYELEKTLGSETHSIIELNTDRHENYKFHQEIFSVIQQCLN